MTSTPTLRDPKDLPTQYVPAQVEGPLYERWVKAGYFEVDATSPKPAYCIVLPPPNVTGGLHLGHAFEHSLIDALIRRRRMQGTRRWRPGMDHAGIATQTSSSASSPATGCRGTTSAARRSSQRCGSGRPSPAGRFSARCAASATALRSRASGSRWTRDSRARPHDLQAVVRRRSHLPRRTHHQLVPALPDCAVRHRGRAQRGRGRARLDQVRKHRRPEEQHRRRDHPCRDDARRHRRRGASRRRALRHLVGTEVELPLTGRRIPRCRRRPRRSRVRHRRGQGDTCARPEQPSRSAPAQLAVAHCPRRARQHHRQRSVPRSRPVRGAPSRRCGATRTRAHRRGGSGRTFTPSVTALAATPSSSRGCRCSGSSRLRRRPAAGDAVRDGRVTIHPTSMEPRFFGWVDTMHD